MNGPTRQARRRELFQGTFRDLTKKYGGERRRVRRSMARDLARRLWRGKAEPERKPVDAEAGP